MFTKYYDKIIFGISLVFVLLLSVFFLFNVDESITDLSTGSVRAATYEALDPEEIVYDTETWQPGVNAGAAEWAFDVFTPPRISYNPETNQFEVTPPTRDPYGPRSQFDVELVDIRPELYRIQLKGYLGVTGDYLLTLNNREGTGAEAMKLGRKGQVLEDAEIEVLDFEVVSATQSGHEYAVATIRDLRTGEEIILRSDEDKVLDSHVVVLRSLGARPRTHEVKEGGTITVGQARYTVEGFDVAYKRATVSKTSPEITGKDTQRLQAGVRGRDYGGQGVRQPYTPPRGGAAGQQQSPTPGTYQPFHR